MVLRRWARFASTASELAIATLGGHRYLGRLGARDDRGPPAWGSGPRPTGRAGAWTLARQDSSAKHGRRPKRFCGPIRNSNARSHRRCVRCCCTAGPDGWSWRRLGKSEVAVNEGGPASRLRWHQRRYRQPAMPSVNAKIGIEGVGISSVEPGHQGAGMNQHACAHASPSSGDLASGRACWSRGRAVLPLSRPGRPPDRRSSAGVRRGAFP